jgi:hypothetical protein
MNHDDQSGGHLYLKKLPYFGPYSADVLMSIPADFKIKKHRNRVMLRLAKTNGCVTFAKNPK